MIPLALDGTMVEPAAVPAPTKAAQNLRADARSASPGYVGHRCPSLCSCVGVLALARDESGFIFIFSVVGFYFCFLGPKTVLQTSFFADT